MTLFRDTPFISAAGLRLRWKIECDALTGKDWECIAEIVGPRLIFNEIEGVPTGGLPFAEALWPYATDPGLLIVDDIFTTGRSMELQRQGRHAEGVVLFARDTTPDWIRPVWTLAEWLRYGC